MWSVVTTVAFKNNYFHIIHARRNYTPEDTQELQQLVHNQIQLKENGKCVHVIEDDCVWT